MGRIKTLAILICAFTLAGCASSQHQKAAPLVSDFGDDVYELTNTTNDMMEMLSNNVTQAQVINYAVKEGDDWNRISFDDLRSINSTLGESLKKLYAASALKALGSYSKSLSDLSSYNTVETINRSSVELHNALVSARDSYQTISGDKVDSLNDESLSLIATAANALGKAYSEQVKLNEMRDVVTRTNPAVQQITAEIKKTFEDGGAYADIFQVTGFVVLSEQFRAEKRVYESKSLEQKTQLIDKYRILVTTIDKSPEILGYIATTAEKVGTAHEKLTEALQEAGTTLADVQMIFSDIKAERERLEEFRKNLLIKPDNEG